MSLSLEYALNSLFFDLYSDRALAAAYRRDRPSVLARYKLSDTAVTAIENNDVVSLSRLTNAFLLRYYFVVIGMADADFLARLQRTDRT